MTHPLSTTLMVCTRCRAPGADPDAPHAGAADLLAAARAHAAAPEGVLPRAAPPERLRAGILARLPPPALGARRSGGGGRMAGLILETFPGAGLVPPPHPGAPPRRRGGTLSGADPGILPAVLRADANLVVWHRELPAPFTAALRTLAVAAPFTAVAEAAPEAAPEALAADLPAPAPLDLLIDIGRLAIAFAAVADTGCAVRLRLEVIAGPACYRWHADAVGLRLLCTYRGLGTEWLPLAGGARVARGLDGAALPCAQARIATGAVAVLKGERFPGNAGFGCIRRSPPAGPGERARLLLCIDEPGRIPLEPCAARRTAP